MSPTNQSTSPTAETGIVVNRSINTCSTAYPSGSVRNPTQIIIKPAPYLTDQPVNRSEKSRTLPYSHRELPHLPRRSGARLIYFSTNAEKSNSSIVKAVLFELRSNPTILASLGASIKPEKDDFFGQLWVDGQINLMQGSVDVAFRVTGSERSGKVYFTSVRRDRGSEFEIIRWKLIRDDGVVVDLVNQDNRPVLVTSTDNEGVAITSLLPTSSLHSTYTETPVVRLV
ncbi:hypothetical protein PSHT_05577 [Puccinia striiformis]|uniref:Uncharacterized protein n=1 Tax=Puccinia striiformis TaxID=27350 RepID=A0A2S4WA31_9BASI|nr:hypothetical protein PSHT_05577 [Puccinia striiformis]